MGDPISTAAVFAFLNSAFKLSEYAVKLYSVDTENGVFVRMIHRVRLDLVETERLLCVPSIKAQLISTPGKLAWIKGVLDSTKSALNEIGRWVERVRADKEGYGTVSWENRIRWVFNDNEKLVNRRMELATSHQALSTVLSYLTPLEHTVTPLPTAPPEYKNATYFDELALSPGQRRRIAQLSEKVPREDSRNGDASQKPNRQTTPEPGSVFPILKPISQHEGKIGEGNLVSSGDGGSSLTLNPPYSSTMSLLSVQPTEPPDTQGNSPASIWSAHSYSYPNPTTVQTHTIISHKSYNASENPWNSQDIFPNSASESFHPPISPPPRYSDAIATSSTNTRSGITSYPQSSSLNLPDKASPESPHHNASATNTLGPINPHEFSVGPETLAGKICNIPLSRNLPYQPVETKSLNTVSQVSPPQDPSRLPAVYSSGEIPRPSIGEMMGGLSIQCPETHSPLSQAMDNVHFAESRSTAPFEEMSERIPSWNQTLSSHSKTPSDTEDGHGIWPSSATELPSYCYTAMERSQKPQPQLVSSGYLTQPTELSSDAGVINRPRSTIESYSAVERSLNPSPQPIDKEFPSTCAELPSSAAVTRIPQHQYQYSQSPGFSQPIASPQLQHRYEPYSLPLPTPSPVSTIGSPQIQWGQLHQIGSTPVSPPAHPAILSQGGEQEHTRSMSATAGEERRRKQRAFFKLVSGGG